MAPSRDPSISAAAWVAHDRAVAGGQEGYLDPGTGCYVFTAATLAGRGTCCGSGCRHCPYPSAAHVDPGRPQEP